MTGLGKGVVGIAVRPAVGMFELISKGTHGMGLVCLGREAITGSAQRRVRAPGAGVDEAAEVSPASPARRDIFGLLTGLLGVMSICLTLNAG